MGDRTDKGGQVLAPIVSQLTPAPDKRSTPTDAEYGFKKGGLMQVFADAERAGNFSVTLTVDDLGATQQMQYDCCHGARPIEGTGDMT
jgi:hypothetical protein